jgi:Ca2+-binding EF-hand superfamily protein
MKQKLMIALSLAALGTAGVALAEHHAGPGPDPMGDKTMTRAEMQQHSAQMFERMDVNKDGRIDAADREARKGAMFDRKDADKDGKLSREELAAGHKDGHRAEGGAGHDRMGKRGEHGGMGKMMLRRADANNDQVVTREEFTAAAASHFDKIDANKDGSVSPEERKAAHEKMRAMMQARKGQPG